MDNWVQKNLQEPIEHLGLLGTLLRGSDVVMLGEQIFLEDPRDSSTGLKDNAVEIIEVRVVIPGSQKDSPTG